MWHSGGWVLWWWRVVSLCRCSCGGHIYVSRVNKGTKKKPGSVMVTKWLTPSWLRNVQVIQQSHMITSDFISFSFSDTSTTTRQCAVNHNRCNCSSSLSSLAWGPPSVAYPWYVFIFYSYFSLLKTIFTIRTTCAMNLSNMTQDIVSSICMCFLVSLFLPPWFVDSKKHTSTKISCHRCFSRSLLEYRLYPLSVPNSFIFVVIFFPVFPVFDAPSGTTSIFPLGT